jgi:hypothetical protein
VSASSPITTLAAGAITPSGDTIKVELVTPDGMPATIKITWPPQPTVCDPRRYAEGAAVAMRLLAQASNLLARIKASRRL